MGAGACKYDECDGVEDPVTFKPVQKTTSKRKEPDFFQEVVTSADEYDWNLGVEENQVTQKGLQKYFVRQASLDPDDDMLDELKTDSESNTTINESDDDEEIPDFIKMTNLTHDTIFSQVKEVLEEEPKPQFSRTDFSLPDTMNADMGGLSGDDEIGELSDFLLEGRDAPLLGEYKLLSPMTFAYFFRRFKADDAEYSIDDFHRGSMEFKPQRTSKWDRREDGWIQREIEMLCKLEAVPYWMHDSPLLHVHSEVRLKKIGRGIFVMHKKTKMIGNVPMCESFILHHVWEITQRRGLYFESYFGIEVLKDDKITICGTSTTRHDSDENEMEDTDFEQMLADAMEQQKNSKETEMPPPFNHQREELEFDDSPSIGEVHHEGKRLPAAIFPTENGKFNVTIMESKEAWENDLVGIHLFDLPKQRVRTPST